MYPKKNVVIDYIASDAKVAPKVGLSSDLKDDDIPF